MGQFGTDFYRLNTDWDNSIRQAVDNGGKISYGQARVVKGRGDNMAIAGYVILTLGFRKESRRWTAQCFELGTATFGRSFEEAKERLVEAVLLHLNTLEDVGERERFFKEHNIKIYTQKPKRCKVPIELPCDEQTVVQPRIQPIPALAYA